MIGTVALFLGFAIEAVVIVIVISSTSLWKVFIVDVDCIGLHFCMYIQIDGHAYHAFISIMHACAHKAKDLLVAVQNTTIFVVQ